MFEFRGTYKNIWAVFQRFSRRISYSILETIPGFRRSPRLMQQKNRQKTSSKYFCKHPFTRPKFLSFSIGQQHKKCAELLRRIYEHDSKELSHYNEIQIWMGKATLETPSKEAIADRYHWHLKQAHISLSESNLLPLVRKKDNPIATAKPWPIAIYLDNIRSAHNVGSILRTTEALSIGTVYFSGMTPFIDHKQVQKTSMGASQWITCHQNTLLSTLPKPIIALETSPQAHSIYDFTFPESFTLVVGNEEYGCSEASLQQADALIEIPMRGRKNSLNVANAFAVAAAEITRQKTQTRYYEKQHRTS